MNSPAGLFITWTVYGTFLPGDFRGWRHRNSGQMSPQPNLDQWHQNRLSHPVITLNQPMRDVVKESLQEICRFRKWMLWGVGVRSNHVHIVVTAPNYQPRVVLHQLKAKATRELRVRFTEWDERQVWARNGDVEILDTEMEIEQSITYVCDAQDRKERDQP